MPTVVVTSKEGSQSYLLEEGRPLFIGRAKECDILLPSPAVSRRHAVVLYKNGICGIKDLGSFNGTLLNDYRIGEPRHITEDDMVRISSFVLRLSLGAPDAIDDDILPPADGPAGIDATVDLSMQTISRPQSPRPDSTRYSSTIRLPRAMIPDDAWDPTLDTLPSSAERGWSSAETTLPFIPGEETVAFFNNAGRIPPGRASSATDVIMPSKKVYMSQPAATGIPGDARPGEAADAREAAEAVPGPDDTAFFREDAESAEPEFAEREPAAAERAPDAETASPVYVAVDDGGDAGPMVSNAEAEALIPLLEPEVAPTLTLEEDKATNEALERLIEDLPTYDRKKYLSEREAAGDVVNSPAPSPEEPLPIPNTGEFPVPGARAEIGWGTGGYDDVGSGGTGGERSTPGTETLGISPTVEGLDNIVISPELMTAISTRLSLYTLLLDLAEERKLLRLSENLPADVKEELSRQDEEMENLPTAAEATRLAAALEEKRKQDAEAGPDPRSGAMRAAEDLARSQWMLIRDSNLEALPAVYKEAYRLAVDEPLAIELTRARIPHGRLLGGAVYLLALETLMASAARERRRISTRIRRLTEDDPGATGVLSKLGQLANNIRNRSEIREQTVQLEKEHKSHTNRAVLAEREMRFITKTLNREFRGVYALVAQRYIPRFDDMPVAVRAFLRYGAIGFKPWWMREELRNFILNDCGYNIVTGRDRSRDELNILYADEYLAAVAEMECSPSPDESLADLEKNSVEVKTDRAYRRIVNARTYNDLMQQTMADLDIRLQLFDSESAALEARMTALKSESTQKTRETMFALQTEHQTVAIRKSNLEQQIKRIEKEVVSSIIDSVQEAEGRFSRGELTMPTTDFLIEREVRAMFEQARRIEDRRERFMPMVLRTSFPLEGDVVNVRGAIRAKMAKIEKLDPDLFVNAIIPAKKKANRVELRISPVVTILPVAGQRGLCVIGREGMEGGHLALPACFLREDIQERRLLHMLADFRWETSRGLVGRDLINSDTLAGAFMRVRWEWRNFPKVKREKGLIFNEQSDQLNWRRIYEVYAPDAMSGGKQLFLRNPDCYNAIIGQYIELPQGVMPLRRSPMSP